MDKPALRRHVRELKSQFAQSFPLWSGDICRRIMEQPLWQSAHTVLLYHALPDEPSLQLLLDEGLRLGKQLLLPVVVGDDLLLKYYKGGESLCEGAFHILEPTGQTFPRSLYGDIELALIPGMAFDHDGHRLGRGRGYYDRLLPRLPHAYKLGICFPFQLLNAVPCEPHDIAMDAVLS